jgi:hypothetical protein
MALYKKTLYEAPSTAYRNTADPLLEIASPEDISLVSPHKFLPEEIGLYVRLKPIICQNTVYVSLKEDNANIDMISLYQKNPPLQSIKLTLEEQDHQYVLHNNQHTFNESLLYSLPQNWEMEFSFQVLKKNLDLQQNKSAPYGGFLHWDPRRCEQLFFTLISNEDNEAEIISLTTQQVEGIKIPQISFGDFIATHGVKISLIFEGEPFLYRSISYQMKSTHCIFIRFIP